MIQKQWATRFAENKICGCEKHEKLKFTSLTISPGTAALQWFLIKKLLSLQFLQPTEHDAL